MKRWGDRISVPLVSASRCSQGQTGFFKVSADAFWGGESGMKTGRPVRVGLVGIGSWSGVIADAMQRSEKLDLVTCFSRTAEKRIEYSRRYGCDQEKSYEGLLKRNDIDGVLLITP